MAGPGRRTPPTRWPSSIGADDLILILGADAAAGLAPGSGPTKWCIGRGSPSPRALALPRASSRKPSISWAARVIWLDMPDLDVSGTDIRLRAAQDRPFRFLVPDPVWRYVLRHGLYEGQS